MRNGVYDITSREVVVVWMEFGKQDWSVWVLWEEFVRDVIGHNSAENGQKASINLNLIINFNNRDRKVVTALNLKSINYIYMSTIL